MERIVSVMGMVMKAEPFDEYDRKVVILTKDKGKITAFARGARRAKSPLAAATNAFCFGTFKLIEYKNSYSLTEANIINYFDFMLTDLDAAIYGMYFLEIADYYTRENADDVNMLKLLYQSVAVLDKTEIERDLVKAIYEIKSIMINGEYPGPNGDIEYKTATLKAIDYMYNIAPEKVYSFIVSDEIKKELIDEADRVCAKTFDKKFTSLEVLGGIKGI